MHPIRRVTLVEGTTTSGTSDDHLLVTPSGKFTVEASFKEGAATTCSGLVIDVEGSITKNNFFALASHTFTAAERTARAAMFHVIDKPVVWIRTNITTLTKVGANAVTVTVDLLSQ